MAYMIEIARRCQHDGCTKQATHQVYAYANELHGRYCKVHANVWTARLTKAEESNPAGFRRV